MMPARGTNAQFDWSQLLPEAWQLATFAVGVSLLIWVTLRLRVWFREDTAGDESAADLLSEVTEFHREGGLSEEEFRLIRSRLAHTLAGEVSSGRSQSSMVGVRMGLVHGDHPSAAESHQGRSDSLGQEAAEAAEDLSIEHSNDFRSNA